ncbi:adenylate kinase [Paenarthrobacter sp. AT5]|uniref:adenylate kinase n=1 Tax=Paenarthrobacter TaxID=1742992 RepID=UPI001A983491|nr:MULTISPECIES: adenylate kinase [Paenarthrobacter]WOC63056.1 adenylate kinase [Paenarthrobacter sp. AT5]
MILMGPPGSGKGTQAARIAEWLGVPAISTGDIFRQNMAKLTSLGIKSKQYIDNGDLVPDAVTNQMVRERLGYPDVKNGFLLDGYPRTPQQVGELDSMLANGNEHLNAVLLLTADDGELVKRLLDRAKVTGRSDDTEVVIRHRLDLYHEQTQPVVAMYAERGLLLSINGVGEVDEVTERILTQLQKPSIALVRR